MPVSEFEIIARYFDIQSVKRNDVVLGIGDDCALLDCNAAQHPSDLLAVTMDTLVAGVHFPEATEAFDIGYKALAVNLSDLAAMGATPNWITLALTLPEASEPWLHEFSQGLFELASQYGVALIGGDITRGPLTITIQAHGSVPKRHALRRSGAREGDLIVISGTLGDAALGLMFQQEHLPRFEANEDEIHFFTQRLNRPQPRVRLGEHLRDIATAAIDISDGLAADLQHILKASDCGAVLDVNKLPFSTAALSIADNVNLFEIAMSSGDDYELCFTIPESRAAELQILEAACGCQLTVIGEINSKPGLQLRRGSNATLNNSTQLEQSGYRHF